MEKNLNLNISLSDPDNRLIYFALNTLMLGLFSFFAPYITAVVIGLFKNYNLFIGAIEITGYQIMFLIAGIIKLVDTVYSYRLLKKVEPVNCAACQVELEQ